MNDIKQSLKANSSVTPAKYSTRLFWIVLFFGLFSSVVAWQIVARYEEKFAIALFQAEAKERSFLIHKQLETASSALEDLASMYAVSNEVSGMQFTRYVAPILARDPTIRALSWNSVITHAEREAHESAVRDRGIANYRITQRSPQGDIETAAQRNQYVVVTAIEPFSDNESAIGFDVSSEITRRVVLERARDTALMSTTAPISLIQAPQQTQSVLGFLPNYRNASFLANVEERRANLAGFFVVVVDVPKAIAAALSTLNYDGVELKIVATAPGAAEAELYVSNQFTQSGEKTLLWYLRDLDELSYSTSFDWGGQVFDLQFVASNDYKVAGQTWVPLGVLFAALALALFAAAMVHVLGGRTVRIGREVAERTLDLQEANRALEAEAGRRSEVEQRLTAYQHDLEREVAARTSELKATSIQLRAILETEPECVKIVSGDGKLEDMNAAGLAMIQADSIEAVRGKNVYALIDAEHRDAFMNLNRRVILGESCTLEFKLNGLKGGIVWVDTHAVPLIDPNGGPTRHLAITRDITARKAAEEQQVRMEGQLRHTQKLEHIGVMAAGIAHDFNNLLQVIIGNNETALGDERIKDSARSSLEASQSAAIDAAKLCDQMLMYAGKSKPEIQSIHMPHIVESMVNLLGVSHSKKAEFELVFEGEHDTIDGDDAQLRQVVMNLVSNASEAVGEQPGRIVVTIGTVVESANVAALNWVGEAPRAGKYVSLEVADNGCGMDAKTQERMFDPFFTTKFSGRGLGLSSTLGIVQSHHGFLKVVSEIGRGTCITILFPASTSTTQVMRTPSKKPATMDQKILLVDDEDMVRTVGQRVLESLGCRVVAARDGAEAVRLFTEQADTFDVVLLDMAMPKMDGNETCAQLRRIRPDVAVIFCSGYAPDVVEPGAGSTGYTGFLHKPYRRDGLIDALQEAQHSKAHPVSEGH